MVNDTSLTACSERTGEASPEWNGRLYGKQTLPFVDMSIKGWLWYRKIAMLSRFRRACRLANLLSITIAEGENNMGGTKGSALANIGYSCEQKALVAGWRRVWSETPGTTDPMAPFGIVTLASSGS